MKTTKKQIILKQKKLDYFITMKIDGCYELDELAETLALEHHLEYVSKGNIENYIDVERELLIRNCLDNFLIKEKEQLVKDFILDRKKAIGKWFGGDK